MNDRISIGQAGLNGRRHALYRFFDASDVLLYVGITVDIGARFKKHSGDKPWWSEVDRIGIDRFSTRQEALDAERKAIKEEQPLHNVVHNEFVEVDGRSDTRKDLALELLHAFLNTPPGSVGYRAALEEARRDSEGDDEQPDLEEIEVLKQVINSHEGELYSYRAAAQEVLDSIPDDRLELYRRLEIQEWSDDGLDEYGPIDDNYLDHKVILRIAGDLAWAGLGQATAEERDGFLNLARERSFNGFSNEALVRRAYKYYKANQKGQLEDLLQKEERRRRPAPGEEAPF